MSHTWALGGPLRDQSNPDPECPKSPIPEQHPTPLFTNHTLNIQNPNRCESAKSDNLCLSATSPSSFHNPYRYQSESAMLDTLFLSATSYCSSRTRTPTDRNLACGILLPCTRPHIPQPIPTCDVRWICMASTSTCTDPHSFSSVFK